MSTKKTIIITGTSSGLGKALFDILHTSDTQLICISRTFPEYQAELASEDVVLLTCDLSNTEEVLSLNTKLSDVLTKATKIVFINNAATIAPIGPIGELDVAEITKAAQTNFVSAVLITNALCALKNISRLTVVHVSTGAARHPIVGWSLYCSTKAALKMFYEVLEEQYKDDERVAVHQFDPGVIDTPMQSQIRKASPKDFPLIEEYKELKEKQELSDPTLVAKRLLEQYVPL